MSILTLETKKYEIKLNNFEGPLDLLVFLIDKNKMDIHKVIISDIADQYIEYINNMESMNLEVASEFLVMASTLLYIKSKALLPKIQEAEEELTEEELLKRIIEYKQYKEVSKKLKMQYETFSNRVFRLPENVVLPKQKIETVYEKSIISQMYSEVINRNENKMNTNTQEKIAEIILHETVTITSKVKVILKELLKKPKFVFNKLFSKKDNKPIDIVIAFLSVLELTKRNRVLVEQKESFGDIIVSQKK
ncbi:MAG: segregation/condensation protein A [Oscillospiraceae bacterium]|nr:segregation/condensation protein A [Oscillospiraceae bacterium]